MVKLASLKDFRAMSFAAEALKKDWDCALHVVANCIWALGLVDEGLQRDPDFVCQALSKWKEVAGEAGASYGAVSQGDRAAFVRDGIHGQGDRGLDLHPTLYSCRKVVLPFSCVFLPSFLGPDQTALTAACCQPGCWTGDITLPGRKDCHIYFL